MKWLEDTVKNNIAAMIVGLFSVIGMYVTMQVTVTRVEVTMDSQIKQLDGYSKSNYAAIKIIQSDVRLLQLDMENQKVQLENVKGENAKLNQTLDKFSDSVNNLAQSVSALQALVQQQSNDRNGRK